MGKKQHQSDKLYISAKEWKNEFGGKKNAVPGGVNAEFRRLPFSCCALSFQEFEHPVCNSTGVVYDLLNIIPYIKKFSSDPATGEKLDAKELTRLHFQK